MQANHDPCTGLPNRRFFAEWLSYAIAHARRERGHVGVLFIAISGTTTVSELHGREATDALLIEIARRFRAASREGDLFARLGTTEFALATPNARDGRQLALLAQRLRDQFRPRHHTVHLGKEAFAPGRLAKPLKVVGCQR
jgi:diguanylate cyclase (GGDEF)-like protein